MRVAIVDIGSNSTRLLIAEVDGDELIEIERRSQVTGLARGLERCGGLAPGAIADTKAAVGEYAELIARYGSERTLAIATSAVRDAANGALFLERLSAELGIETRLLDGETEAGLSYAGASNGSDGAAPTLVIDIGGGSTELIIGRGEEIVFHTSLRLGVVRHGERYLASDPPAQSELADLTEDARGTIAAAVSRVTELPEIKRAIALAGTPTSLASIDLGLQRYDAVRVEGHVIGRERIERELERLASLSLERRRRVRGLHADRAGVIVAGTVILLAVFDAFGLSEIEVSEHDILWGAALELAGA